MLKADFWLDVLSAWRDEWKSTVEWYQSGHYNEPCPEMCPWCGREMPPDDEPRVPLSVPKSEVPPGVFSEIVYVAGLPREGDIN
jgi:hypothetical protein